MPQQTPTIDPLDAVIRHQIYVEGYKNHEEQETDSYLDEIIALLLLLLLKTNKSQLSQLTKREFNQVIITFNKTAKVRNDKFSDKFITKLSAFFNADYSMLKYMFERLSGKKVSPPNTKRLWASFNNAPQPGIGIEPKLVIRNYLASVITTITKVLKQSYAENWTIQETVKQITGTKANNYKDGQTNKLLNQLKSVANTFIHSISSFLGYSISKLLFEQYEWVSILDSRTTVICRHRDGLRYYYGKGPIPPAHYNCRSTIVPVMTTIYNSMPTFVVWLTRQPKVVQDDVLGAARATRFRRGDYDTGEENSFGKAQPLTLEQFKGKRNNLLTTS